MVIPGYYEEVSVKLIKVLDKSGYGEKARWKKVQMWIQYEKLTNVIDTCDVRTHIFGSRAEATDMGIKSDIDLIMFPDFITVMQDLQSWEPGLNTVLMITDNTTPPGYIKLQEVYTNAPIPKYNQQTDKLMFDVYGRSVLHNAYEIFKWKRADKHHGPVNTHYYDSGISSDLVNAYRVVSWPSMALEWTTRTRNYNWPSQETIAVIQQSGTLLVPVGQPISPERHLEWRISLSYGEKILVWQFSSSQYK